MRLQWIFGRVVLLYQMPKTGSQTLEATLGLTHSVSLGSAFWRTNIAACLSCLKSKCWFGI